MPRTEGSSPSSPLLATAVRDGFDVAFTALRPMFRLEGRSPADRARAHELNVAHRWMDLQDFEKFLSAFVAEARTAKTLDAFIAHGRPVFATWEDRLREPGASFSERRDLEPVIGAFRAALRDALGELEGIRAGLEGRRAPLDVDLKASVAVKAHVHGAQFGIEASLDDRAAGASFGTPMASWRSSSKDGVATDRIDLGGGPVAVTLDRDRIESVELRSPVGAYARLEGSAVEIGIAAGRRFGRREGLCLDLQAKAGVSVNGIDPETVRRALSNRDEWAVKRR